MKKTILLLLSFTVLFNFSLSAQKEKKEKKAKATFVYDSEDSNDYKKEDRAEVSKPTMPKYDIDQTFQVGKKKKKQQQAFSSRKYFFPSKPQNAWQIGVFGGVSILSGDVDANLFKGHKTAFPGHNFGLFVAKSWSYLFSTRLRYSTFTMLNFDNKASTLTFNQRGRSGLTQYGPAATIYHNSRTQGHDLMFDAIFSIGNVKFHKEHTNVLFKVFPTVGVMINQTFLDQLDENGNAYDYQTLLNDVGNNVIEKKDVAKTLSNMRDGAYESHPEVVGNTILGGYNSSFVFGFGAGVTFRLTSWMYLDIESRQHFTSNDLLDGMRWSEPAGTGSSHSSGLTPDNDSYNQTTIGLTFNLIGKKTTEPLTMLNPMHYTYQVLAESDPEQAIDDLLKDDDNDGVPNRLDHEENTIEGAEVSAKGVAIDSDKDGIVDLNDNEPFSPPGYSVDDKGVAIGTDAQLVQKVKTIVDDMDNSEADCEALSVTLPSVHFDKDKYNIKPEYYAHIHEVAQRLLMCPNAKVLATGSADRDNDIKYNEQLSYNRVDHVIDYIVFTYGIDRNRFIVKYDGETAAKGNLASEQYLERKVSFKLAEDETGNSNPSEPHPGMKAGKNK
jgi:OOP family OmpA-OmpF porin